MKPVIKHLLGPRIRLLLAIGYTIVMTVALLSPIEDKSTIDIPYLDKIVHIVINCLLWLVWSYYIQSYFDRKLFQKIGVRLFFIAVVYGILIEVIQEVFVPTRGADIYDVIANIVGLLLGSFVIMQSRKLIL